VNVLRKYESNLFEMKSEINKIWTDLKDYSGRKFRIINRILNQVELEREKLICENEV
jgi:hypothetical protein